MTDALYTYNVAVWQPTSPIEDIAHSAQNLEIEAVRSAQLEGKPSAGFDPSRWRA